MNIPAGAKLLVNLLKNKGFDTFAVGGCVRDHLMNIPCGDIDIATSAEPTETEKILSENQIRFIPTGLKHGTITAVVSGESYEITTFRRDGAYGDNRHPDQVTFVDDITEDLSRRDFTMNAIGYNDERGFVDPFNGQEDIRRGLIRAVGDADIRFREDALRIMRAVRFAAVLGFSVEEKTEQAIFRNRYLLKNVAGERLFTELTKMLTGDYVFDALMRYRDVIAVLIPPLADSFDCVQNNKWHLYDVYTHTCKSVACAPKDPVLRLVMLLHDVGKPARKTTDGNGVDHFYGHPAVSRDLAGEVLERFQVSREIYDRTLLLVRLHDRHITTEKKNLKKWLSQIGVDRTLDLIAVKKADMSAQNTALTAPEMEALDRSRELLNEILKEKEPFQLADLAVSGNDIKLLGLKGREIGEALRYLLEQVIEGKAENTKQELLLLLKEKMEQKK